ncbi:MAG: hypothetical protein LBV23_10330, partial [Deltaproteobacteria bacterium]|nr:hypothetical protein [Deltaproteobacteria bacterium]
EPPYCESKSIRIFFGVGRKKMVPPPYPEIFFEGGFCATIKLDIKQKYDYIFVDQETFEKYHNAERVRFKKFANLLPIFTKYN